MGKLPDHPSNLPLHKISKYFPDKKNDTILLKWQIDIWPQVLRIKRNTTEWTIRDSKFLLIKLTVQKPRKINDFDFTRLSKIWDQKTIEYQFNMLMKSVPVSSVLPLQVVLSQLLDYHHLSIPTINQISKRDDFKSW